MGGSRCMESLRPWSSPFPCLGRLARSGATGTGNCSGRTAGDARRRGSEGGRQGLGVGDERGRGKDPTSSQLSDHSTAIRPSEEGAKEEREAMTNPQMESLLLFVDFRFIALLRFGLNKSSSVSIRHTVTHVQLAVFHASNATSARSCSKNATMYACRAAATRRPSAVHIRPSRCSSLS